MKKIFIVFSFILIIGFANGQEKNQKKILIGIIPFTCLVEQRDFVLFVQEMVVSTFAKSNQFVFVERDKFEGLKKEIESQKGEDFIESKAIETGKLLGAQFLISGNINSCTSEFHQELQKLLKNSKKVFPANISLSIKVINITSGQVIAIDTFTGTSKGENALDAKNKAVKALEPSIEKFIKKNFPLVIGLAEISTVTSKGEAKIVLVTGGKSLGFKKGDKLNVIEVTELEVEGKKLERNIELGELKISKIDDDNFSTCTVISGGLEINSKFNAKAKLKVTAKE
jgi:hypothetical protein